MTATKDDVIVRRLARLCLKWGGELRRVSSDEYDRWMARRFSYSEAPFSSNMIGVAWKKKWVITSGTILWTDVIHEMGHVFASKKSPETSDEWAFFGWEYALVKHVRGPFDVWKENNKDYAVNDGGLFGHLRADQIATLLKERTGAARELGLLDKRGRPVAIR